MMQVRALVESLAPIVREYVITELHQRDAVIATLRAQQEALLLRLAAVEAREPIVGRDGRDGAPGERGERGLDGMPGTPGRDGIDGLPGRDGKDGRDGVSPDPEAMRRDIASEVARQVALIPLQVGPPGPPGPQGLDGAPGRDGVDGKDGTDGQPGRDGRDGLPGLPGEKGLDGKDGRNGLDGKDGRDGLSIEHLDAHLDVETKTIHLSAVTGDVRREWAWPIPLTIHRGVWEEGREYAPGDQVTHSSSHWTAREATRARPGGDDRTWVLSTKRGPIGPRGEKGADGRDGRPGRDLTQMDDTGRKW